MVCEVYSTERIHVVDDEPNKSSLVYTETKWNNSLCDQEWERQECSGEKYDEQEAVNSKQSTLAQRQLRLHRANVYALRTTP